MAEYNRGVLGEQVRQGKPRKTEVTTEIEPTPVTVVETYFTAWERWGKRLLRLMEVTALTLAIIGVPMLMLELKDRQKNQINAAWQLVTTPAPGNSGKGPALEYLNSHDDWAYDEGGWCDEWCPEWTLPLLPIKQRVSLTGIDLSAERHGGPVDLSFVDLSGANLWKANLSRLDLRGASLNGTMLRDANLSGANLGRSNLSGANLMYTNLSGANLMYTNLSGANLWGANLSGANLRGATLTEVNLLEANLSGANVTGMGYVTGSKPRFAGIYCEESYYIKQTTRKDRQQESFPCKPYGRKEPDPDNPEEIRVYLRCPEGATDCVPVE